MLKNGMDVCTCKRKKCERHGNCEECMDHHKTYKKNVLPYCMRKGNNEADKVNKKS